jgi:hypothetical protein
VSNLLLFGRPQDLAIEKVPGERGAAPDRAAGG